MDWQLQDETRNIQVLGVLYYRCGVMIYTLSRQHSIAATTCASDMQRPLLYV